MPTPSADVAYLLRRAAFGGSAERIAQLATLDRPALVEAVLDTTNSPPDDPPASTGKALVSEWQQTQDLSTWWLNRMISSPTPIVEKMTLFWHNHFVSSQDKVQNTSYMWRQNHTFRTAALGYFPGLAKASALQPAMLAYLDNRDNVKGAPNQNFARELMELFTLGVGNYTEDDIIASARAWTGHGIDDTTRSYKFTATNHDNGLKTFFGTTKNWDGPDIINEILTNPTSKVVAARFLTRKLWAYFAYPNPSDAIVNPLADAFAASGFNIKALLRQIFLHNEFWSTTARQGLVRSPVEYVVNLMRATGLKPQEVNPEWYLGDMGQQLFYPPDVSGWKSNGYWISTSAASARANFAQHAAWVLKDKGAMYMWSPNVSALVVPRSLTFAGVTQPSANTVTVLRNYVDTQRPLASWPVLVGLVTLTFLTPEMQLA